MSRPVLKLYNTLSRTKEPFAPLDPAHVRMYVCGPTVYDYAHIGNARPMIVFDVLFRLLRHMAGQGAFDGGKGETRVTYARNITDVDDKINARAFERWTRKRPLLAEMRELTEGTVAQFNKDLKALNVLGPDDVNVAGSRAAFHTPRATDFVANGEQPMDMVRIIEKLVARGVAYAAEGHVLFSPTAMDKLPGMPKYGALSKRNLDDMLAGARVDVAPYKRDPMDFVLWKPSNPETEPGWNSPWGFGRPGWHIECSAMAGALLGEQFDIHGGGIDLVFPHHENEIAQSCCAFGIDKMASIWMHNGFLQVEGKKMSKSDGNFVTIDELLNTDKFGGRPWPGEVLRLAMLKTHYRQPIDWTVRALEEASGELNNWSHQVPFASAPAMLEHHDRLWARGPSAELVSALADDLNTNAAITVIRDRAKNAHPGNVDGEILLADLNFMGILKKGKVRAVDHAINFESGIRFDDALRIAIWAKAGVSNNSIQAIRIAESEAEKLGFVLNIERTEIDEGDVSIQRMNRQEQVEVEGKVQSLINARLEARRAKNFAESDRIRDELAAMGIALKDGKDADGNPVTTWEVKR